MKEEFIKKYENYYDELREYVKRETGEGSLKGIEKLYNIIIGHRACPW